MGNRQIDADSTLGSGIRITGNILGEGYLALHGEVQGDITIDGDLVIGQGAQVVGTVQAAQVTVQGVVDGDVVASGAVHAHADAVLTGSVTGTEFSMEEGAIVSATINTEFELPIELR